MDQVKDYIRSNRADLASFLDWWSSNSGKLTVPAPEGDEAVRIMTIHKSKGLGFSTVIVPFTEFEFKGKPDIMWCKPQTAPFNKMPLVPVYKSDILEETHFRDDLKRENFLRVVDSMNLTYVAFTRAKDNLFICVEEPASSSKSVKGAGDIVFSYFASKLNEKSVLIFGESVVIPDVDRKPVSMHLIPMFKSHDNSDNLRLTLRSEEFFNKEEISRARGVVIHSILSKIKTAKDIEMAVKNAVSIGELEKSDENQVINYFSKLIKSVEKYNWFTHETSVMTEQEIIIPGGKIYRPDRIINSDEISIVDFKTGKLKTKSHQAQIERYAASLKQMTVKKIRSYLWYLDVDEIIEVI
jgi:ATP-dependent exoDNAse (exonuclease V) beta subunit